MKTVLIWDQCAVEPVQFAVLEGDMRHLNGVYINSTSDDEAKQQELSDLVYDKNGTTRINLSEDFPVAAVRAGAEVIVAGFLP